MNQRNNPYQAVVFDFGGVLIDWNPRYLYHNLFNGDAGAVERFLVEIGFMEWNLQQDKGRPFAMGVAELSKHFPHYADLIRAYDERWEESIGGPIQATVNILASLKQAGYRLYGLSNWSAEKFYGFSARYEFFAWFEDIILSGDVQLVKPDPRIYMLLLARIGRTAEECLFIDDSEANILVAHELGFGTIRYESPEQLAAALYQRGLLPQNRHSRMVS